MDVCLLVFVLSIVFFLELKVSPKINFCSVFFVIYFCSLSSSWQLKTSWNPSLVQLYCSFACFVSVNCFLLGVENQLENLLYIVLFGDLFQSIVFHLELKFSWKIFYILYCLLVICFSQLFSSWS